MATVIARHPSSLKVDGASKPKTVPVPSPARATTFSSLSTVHSHSRPSRIPTSSSATATFPLTAPDPRSTYHIYHERCKHFSITTTIDARKERQLPSFPTRKSHRKASGELKEASLKASDESQDGIDDGEKAKDAGDCFVQTPHLAFHNPPRVLRAGSGSKHGTPIALIHNSWFWRRWTLQFGGAVAAPGVIDPRGVVALRAHGGGKDARERDPRLLKGYKVRGWRLWGESGKAYVRGVRAMRKEGRLEDPDVVGEGWTHPIIEKTGGQEQSFDAGVEDFEQRARADEVVYLDWTSPFSRDTRRYHFQYAGVDFYWKGTGTVRESRTCGFWLHFNHLKLVAKLPSPYSPKRTKDDDVEQREICLGRYTSSLVAKKSGMLELFDAAIWRFVMEYLPSYSADLQTVKNEKTGFEEGLQQQLEMLKGTRLYHVIVATAICMIIAEKQKRETVRKILEIIASEGGGNA